MKEKTKTKKVKLTATKGNNQLNQPLLDDLVSFLSRNPGTEALASLIDPVHSFVTHDSVIHQRDWKNKRLGTLQHIHRPSIFMNFHAEGAKR